MQAVGEVLKTLMPELTLVSEIGRHTCIGCGNEVVTIEMPVLGGPNKGQIIQKKRGCVCWENEQAREAKRQQQIGKIKHMVDKFSTINPDLANASFENYETSNHNLRAALKESMEYANNFSLDKPQNLLFAGLYGLGKSHLAYSICKAVQAQNKIAVFVSVPKLLTIIKSTYNSSSGFTEAELLNTLSTVDLLALDDIGAEKAKKDKHGNEDAETWANEKIFEIIDGRSGRHTIYTTNLSSDELRARVGQRNFSRMMMNTKPLKFEGDDYRIKNKMF